jgi:hypothetical protein
MKTLALLVALRAVIVCLMLSVLLILASKCAHGDESRPKYKIAIIDTGYSDHPFDTQLKLCKTGHFDFRSNTPTIGSSGEHGNVVSLIIAEKLKNVDYCAVIYQWADEFGYYTIEGEIRALQLAKKEHFTAINMSLNGRTTSVQERELLKSILDEGTTIFVASGNDGSNLDYECLAFPTCYKLDGLYSVGAVDMKTGKQARFSNHGSVVKLWFSGEAPPQYEARAGTSFAVPRALSEYILRLEKK